MRVLILDIDTLRPDHLGCYGYGRNTSPNIDRIASEGVRFNNYFCPDAPCLPSRSALLTGQFGINTGVVNHGGTNADMRLQGRDRGFRTWLDRESLWATFRSMGLKTTSFSPFGERHSAFWWYAGLNEMHNTGGGGMESAEETTPLVLDWIDRNAAEDNWMLHVNYWDPHGPYRAPAEFGNPFEGEPAAEWITEDVFKTHRAHVGPHSSREVMMYHSDSNPEYPRWLGELKDLDDVKTHFDGYDCGIRYADDQVGAILAAMEKKGVLDDLAIIVTSDHGENQGELGIYVEHATADNITCRIPMIIRWPGGRAGHVDNGLHYNLDLAPTLAEMFGQEAQPAWDGVSYAPAVAEGRECGRDYLVVSQCAHVCQRSVRTGPWIYMRTYHDGYHLFPDEMLYNVEDDPHEQHDLAQERPEVCAEAARLLGEWHTDMMSTVPDGVDPLQTVLREGGPFQARGHLRKYCERLAATDRGWAVEELKRRHPGEFQ